MEFNDLIFSRRSLREFDPQHAMPDSDLDIIIDAARHTPTAFNIQNWRFVAVRDRAIKEKLAKAAYGQQQVATNSVLLVLTADLKAWDRSTERYHTNSGPEFAARMADMTRNFYKDKPVVERDEAMRSVGMAATAIMLAAINQGYATSPMIGFDAEAVAAAINLPQDHVIGMMIAVGKSTQTPFPKTELPRNAVLVYDFFPS